MQNGQTTVYVGAIYEKNISTGEVTTYYFAGSQRVAMRKGGVPTWFIADHLGSTSLTLDASGNKIGEMKYMPFGETRPGYPTGSVPTDRRFTGQREESGLGSLYDYNARFYSPALGRFLSADTLVPDGKNPQAWNRYAYVVNSPLKYNDPTGHCFFICGLIGGAIGAIAGAVGYTAQVITTGSGWNSDAYWATVGAGASTGALVGSTLGVAAPVVAEAASVTLAGASAATGSGTLATAATSTYAAAGTMATVDTVAFKVVSDKFSQLGQINFAPSSPAPSVPALGSSSGSANLSLSDGDYFIDGDLQVSGEPIT